jgi:Zn-dependent protease with chaperone function
MHVVVYLPLALTALAALAARPLADRLPPVTATWLLAGSALVLAATSGAVLGLLALTALIRVPLIASGHWSLRVVSQQDPASLPVAIVAGCLLAVALTATARVLWRRGRAIRASHLQARELPGRNKIVITDDEAADAYTLAGMPCRIVVTTGMLRALDGPEQRVLLAHERAHAAWHHYLFTSSARLAAAANPLLRPVASAVGYTVERWADERAARLTGDRRVAAAAIARAALAAKTPEPAIPGTSAACAGPGASGGPGGAGASAGAGPAGAPLSAAIVAPAEAVLGAIGIPGQLGPRGAGPVPRRVAALLRPAPRTSRILVIVAVLLVLVAGASALEAARDLHALLEVAGNH